MQMLKMLNLKMSILKMFLPKYHNTGEPRKTLVHVDVYQAGTTLLKLEKLWSMQVFIKVGHHC